MATKVSRKLVYPDSDFGEFVTERHADLPKEGSHYVLRRIGLMTAIGAIPQGPTIRIFSLSGPA